MSVMITEGIFVNLSHLSFMVYEHESSYTVLSPYETQDIQKLEILECISFLRKCPTKRIKLTCRKLGWRCQWAVGPEACTETRGLVPVLNLQGHANSLYNPRKNRFLKIMEGYLCEEDTSTKPQRGYTSQQGACCDSQVAMLLVLTVQPCCQVEIVTSRMKWYNNTEITCYFYVKVTKISGKGI